MACSFAADEADEDETFRVQLLGDLRGIFAKSGKDRLRSSDLCSKLEDLEERPWGSWRKGQPMDERHLARALKPFGISPKTIRVSEKSTPKGYEREQFEDAWLRYLPPAERNTATTR